MKNSTLRKACDVVAEKTWKGGQYVGTDSMLITITHRETGIKVVLPQLTKKSQHKRVEAGLDVIEYLLNVL